MEENELIIYDILAPLLQAERIILEAESVNEDPLQKPHMGTSRKQYGTVKN